MKLLFIIQFVCLNVSKTLFHHVCRVPMATPSLMKCREHSRTHIWPCSRLYCVTERGHAAQPASPWAQHGSGHPAGACRVRPAATADSPGTRPGCRPQQGTCQLSGPTRLPARASAVQSHSSGVRGIRGLPDGQSQTFPLSLEQ